MFILYVFCNLFFASLFASNVNFNTPISSIVFYRNKFLLCMPQIKPSLNEIQWLGVPSTIPTKLKPIPKQDNLETCSNMDIETRNGRLWVIDKPESSEKNAKLIIYNLLIYTEVQDYEFKEIPKNSINTIVLDPIANPLFGSRAYIDCSDTNDILVYTLKERRYWRLKIENANFNGDVKFFTISKKDSILYFTGMYGQEMFSLNLNTVRKIPGPPAIVANEEPVHINATSLGNKLGTSSGLITDLKGSLYYYLIRDYALVKWDTKKSLRAENHDIVLQSAEKLPFITNFFVGPQYYIWAIINYRNDSFSSKETVKKYKEFNLFDRITKIGPLF